MRRSPRLPIARVSLAVAVAILMGFAPLIAHAEERGPDELGHFIGVLSVFSFFFLSGVLMMWSFFVGTGPVQTGWTMYSPLASTTSKRLPAARAKGVRDRASPTE